MDTRQPFSVGTILGASAVLTASLAVKPSFPRPAFFIGAGAPALYLLGTTTGSSVTDYLMAFAMIFFLLTASDLILLSTPQSELRWARQKEGPIEDTSVIERAKYALRLFASLRYISWNNEPNVYGPRIPSETSRTSFLTQKLVSTLMWVVAADMSTLYVMQCPAFRKDGMSFAERPPHWKLVDMTFWAMMVSANATLIHSVVCMLSVALHISRPEDWKASFGLWSDAYTIRRFWGRTWHQYLRRFLAGHGKFVSRNVLKLKTGSNASSYVQLYVAFFLSGVMHLTAEYKAGMEWTKSTSIQFFLIQATGIMFEDTIIAAGRKMGIGKQTIPLQLLGYAWVIVWFYMTLPPWWDPIHRLGLLDMFDRTLLPMEMYEKIIGFVAHRLEVL